jgi:hypothetical protein
MLAGIAESQFGYRVEIVDVATITAEEQVKFA